MIVGVDVSSKRIDLAWLEDGKPQRWHQELAKGHLIDRLRSIRVQWPEDRQRLMPGTEDSPHIILKRGIHDFVQSDVTDIAIEMPFGRSRASIAALMSTVGVITRQAPPWARVAWPSSGELRAAIGARNTKTDAHHRLGSHFADRTLLDFWNEHELDALVACLGWTHILAQQDAA